MKKTKKGSSKAKGRGRSQSLKPYEAEKHLRNFCSATSHELANAIGAIVGELDYALSSPTKAEQDRAMTISLKAAEKALSLARNLRYFAVHTRLDIHSVDLAQVLLDSIDLVEKSLELRKIKMEIFVEANTYTTVDPSAIQQVVLNLLTNAGNSMPNGGKLTISLAKLNSSVEIVCSDTGIGIPEGILERIFEPQFNDEEMPHFKEHQGLGLAVSKVLVEAHGGDIQVSSKVGQGTSFSIRLPFEPNAPKPSPFLEKRRFRRVQLSLPVEISYGETTFRTEITTLSVGGCFVRFASESVVCPEVSTAVTLRILHNDDQVISVTKARVASRITQGVIPGSGIEFLDVDAKGRKLLAAIVKSHAT